MVLRSLYRLVKIQDLVHLVCLEESSVAQQPTPYRHRFLSPLHCNQLDISVLSDPIPLPPLLGPKCSDTTSASDLEDPIPTAHALTALTYALAPEPPTPIPPQPHLRLFLAQRSSAEKISSSGQRATANPVDTNHHIFASSEYVPPPPSLD